MRTGWLGSLALAVVGCGGGGHINAVVKMPGPGGIERPDESSMVLKPGVIVDARDGTSVCERIRVYITPMSSPPSSPGAVPGGSVKYSGRGIGSYDPVKRECVAAAFDLEPRDDYWMVVDYPVSSPDDRGVAYYSTGKPSLRAPRVSAGQHPVRVVAKETTSLTLTMSVVGAELPAP